MKIAFISLMRSSAWAGSEELWFRVAKQAIAKGHSVVSLTQRWDKLPAKIQELQQLGVETNFYDAARHSILEKVAIKLSIKRGVIDIIPKIEADIMVFSNGSTWDFIYSHYLAKEILSYKKPYILISQHNFENGHIVKQEWREYALSTIQNAQTNFFVSARNLKTAERQLGTFITEAQIVSNPVTIKSCGIKSYPISSTLLMACVARLECDFKGQDILLQVLSTQAWAARDFSLKFYGSGPHLEHIQQLIVLYNLQDKVRIEGQVNDIDLVWENNQVLVLPSLSEGTPLALIEAMLSGRAAVTTDVGGNHDYIRDGDTGFLAATASVMCLSASLETLWNNKHHLKAMGEAAFAHAYAITDLHPENKVLNCIEQLGSNRESTGVVR